MQLSERIYEQLQPDQRFRAAVEAFARRDLTEIDRLHDTVEYVNVRVQSPAYFERIRGLQTLAMMHGIFARDATVAFWAALRAFERSEPEREAGAAEAEDPADVVGDILGRLKAYETAWQTFCAELGIDPAMVDFCYFDTCRFITGLFADETGAVEPHDETLNGQLEFLRQGWRRHLDRGRVRRS